MADQSDPDIPEVLSGQARQHFSVNRVVAKRQRILLEAQRPQPIGDVKRHRQRSIVQASVAAANLEWADMALGFRRQHQPGVAPFGMAALRRTPAGRTALIAVVPDSVANAPYRPS